MYLKLIFRSFKHESSAFLFFLFFPYNFFDNPAVLIDDQRGVCLFSNGPRPSGCSAQSNFCARKVIILNPFFHFIHAFSPSSISLAGTACLIRQKLSGKGRLSCAIRSGNENYFFASAHINTLASSSVILRLPVTHSWIRI